MIDILWIDDEIESLQSIIKFLSERDFKVLGIDNAEDAFSIIEEESVSLIILDQMMPGLDGMGFLEKMESIGIEIPVVMMTKIDDENFMEEVFAKKVEDILIKPVSPKQVLAVCKKYLQKEKILEETTQRGYGRESREILMGLNNIVSIDDWYKIAMWVSRWNIKLDKSEYRDLRDLHKITIQNLNNEFIYFIKNKYRSVLDDNSITKSNNLLKNKVFQHLSSNKKIYFILFDCMRLDIWLIFKEMLEIYFNIKTDCYMSILPTLTSYSRNSIFSGKFPDEMGDMYQTIWDENDLKQNRFEEGNLKKLLLRYNYTNWDNFEYVKLVDLNFAGRMGVYNKPGFIAIVVNFLDMLIHFRAKSELTKRSLPNDTAFRKIVKNWFENSKFLEFFERISQEDAVIFITSDHGAITVKKDLFVKGSRISNIQFRYAEGYSIMSDKRNTMTFFNPSAFHLPSKGMNYRYILALGDSYLKPKDYKGIDFSGTMQHGGISIEEMILPIATLKPKK